MIWLWIILGILAYIVIGSLVWGLGIRLNWFSDDDGPLVVMFWVFSPVIIAVAFFAVCATRLSEWIASFVAGHKIESLDDDED